MNAAPRPLASRGSDAEHSWFMSSMHAKTSKEYPSMKLQGFVRTVFCLLIPLALPVGAGSALPIATEEGNIQFLSEASPPDEPLSLWYRRPAKEWVQALALGNGRMGGMIFGGINTERIQLSEDTIWAGGPYDP